MRLCAEFARSGKADGEKQGVDSRSSPKTNQAKMGRFLCFSERFVNFGRVHAKIARQATVFLALREESSLIGGRCSVYREFRRCQ